jgi:hypothetical protein
MSTPTPEPVTLWAVTLHRHDGQTRHRVVMSRDTLDALLEVIKDAGQVHVWTATTEWRLDAYLEHLHHTTDNREQDQS